MAMTKDLKTSPLLDLDTARVMLGGISRKSLERLIARRRLRVVRPGGLRRVFVRVTDVQRLIR
jgi:hypothetical protein